MRRIANDRGFTLVELMIAMAIFAVVMSAVYSVYIAILKNVVTQRNVAKTELDVVTVAWPLAKEIYAAGYGVPPTTSALSYASRELTIHSTVAGDDENVDKLPSLFNYIKNQYTFAIVISHDERVKKLYDTNIDVVGTDNGSYILYN